MPKQTYLILLTLGLAISIQAQSPHPAWRNYTTDDGLPDITAYCVIQDSKGFIWAATDKGVCRFDGYTFQQFPASDEINYLSVFEMQEDTEGRIWFPNMDGSLYYVEKDSIFPYWNNDIIQNLRKGFEFCDGSFHIQKGGEKVFINFQEFGVVEMETNGEYQIHQVNSIPAWLAFDVGNKPFLSSSASQNSQEITLKDSELAQRNLERPLEIHGNGKIIRIENLKRFPNISVTHTLQKIQENGYLFYIHFGLHFIQNGKKVWSIPYANDIVDIFTAQDGGFYFCEIDGGLKKYAGLEAIKEGKFEQYLPGLTATWVYEDRGGGIWVATHQQGLFYTPNIQTLTYDQRSGLSGNRLRSIAVKNENEVFFGLRNGDVYLFNAIDQDLFEIAKTNAKLDHFACDLTYDALRDELWICRPKFYKWKDKKLIEANELTQRALDISKYSCLSKDGQRLWGLGYQGYCGLDLKTQKVIFDSYEMYNYKTRAYAILETYNQRTLFATNEGLFESRDTAPVIPTDLPKGDWRFIRFLEQLPDSTILVGSRTQGLMLWKGADVFSITKKDGLTSNTIGFIHIDYRGHIWIATDQGLNEIQLNKDRTYSIRQFTTAHGLPSNVIHGISSSKQHVWVATNKGAVRMPLIPKNTNALSPVISRVEVHNNKLDLNGEIKLAPDQNSLTFYYTALKYSQLGRTPYRYRLAKEITWNYSKNHSVNFANLRPGSYTFEVQAQNEDGFWSTSTILPFTIRPPFWETWWFFTLAALIIGFIIYRFYKYRTNQIRREADTVKQMAELERSALRAQMNPHFIFNCLTSISNFIDKGDKVSANNYLATFARLIRGVLNHSRTDKVSLEDELQLLENYLKLEQLRFENGFDYLFKLGEGVEPFEIEIPPMMVQPFVENAIIHGLAKKEGKGQIDLLCELENGHLNITISDNGVGIEQSQKKKSAGLHKSVGMSITRRRLELLGGRNEVVVRELKGEDGKVGGTEVRLKIQVE